ncbi:SAM-dependent methyltransferase [Actinomycetospora chiangmaiensis]|uniref:SAM-dependent methyltransferase n=1 Tax=Actinomycetospora chiangmaiensis TaxID=402650 RepID=UPI0003765F66|nr:SAM-dependent methyltransferase [Actinomycetospora chiangmaiensis]
MSEVGPADAAGQDVGPANAARMYDYYLGGSANFAVDRALADRAIAVRPALPAIARANRAFLNRVVAHLVGCGVDQFLDLGSGIPTVGNVHEVAARSTPDARVVYVDREPVAVAYAQELLRGHDRATVVHADLRDSDRVCRDAAELLDFSRPVALLAVAALHFLPDADDPAGVLARYRGALTPGSYLALSHGTGDHQPVGAGIGTALYQQSTSPITLRTHAEVTALFDGFQVLDPGVVFTSAWRPDLPGPHDRLAARPEQAGFYAGLARLGPG